MNWIIFALGVCTASDAIEVLLINSLSSSSTFQATFNRESTGFSDVSSFTFFGMFLGGLTASLLNNRMGLRNLLLTSLSATFALSLLTNLASDILCYSFLRLLIGISIGSSIPPTFTLASLHSNVKDRGRDITSVAYFWMFGSIYISVAAYFMFEAFKDLDWRIFNVTCSLPSGFALFLVHQHVGEPKGTTRRGGVGVDQLKSMRNLYNKVEQRRRTVLLQLCWFSLSFSTFSLLSVITPLFSEVGIDSEYLVTVIFSSSALVGNIGSYVCVGYIPRRTLLCASAVCASLSAFLFAFSADKTNEETNASSNGWVIIFAACLFQICDTAAWNVADIVSTEQFVERRSKATGFGICSATGRLGAFAAQFINGALIDGRATELLVIDGVMLLICGICALGLDERCRFLVDGGDEEDEDDDDEAEEEYNDDNESKTLVGCIE